METKKTTLKSGLEFTRNYTTTGGAVLMHNDKTIEKYQSLLDERAKIDTSRYNCFFAFGREQFEDEKKRIPLKEGEKIVAAGLGLYGTKEGLHKFFDAQDEITARIRKECDPQEVYFYEYNNHECMVNGDDQNAYDIVERIWGDAIAKEIVRF